MKSFLRQAGFTMIELLVVIAVIGVLAVAVLSSINPIEQINKGRDTRTRSDAAQLINAVDRFFASQEKYPWNDPLYACGTGSTCTPALGTPEQDPAIEFPSTSTTQVCQAVTAGNLGQGGCQLDATGGRWLDGLEETSEVKGEFINRIRAQTTYAIYAYKPAGTDATLYSCFRPSSNAFQREAIANCSSDSVAGQWGDPILEAMACPDGPVGAGYATAEDGVKDELICLP